MSLRATALTCLLAVGVPVHAAAQRLVIGYAPELFTPPVTQVIDLGSGTVESTENGVTLPDPLFTSDGRYLTFGSGESWGVRDLLAAATFSVPIAFHRLIAHPRETAIFGLARPQTGPLGILQGQAARLDPSGVREYAGCEGVTRTLDISADGSRVVLLCESGDVATVDSVSGVVRHVVAVGAVGNSIASNHDGSRALIVRGSECDTVRVVLIDTATGVELGSAAFSPISAPSTCRMTIVGASPDRRAAAVTHTQTFVMPILNATSDTRLIDLDTAVLGERLPVSFEPTTFAISPDGRTLFAASHHVRGYGALQIIDLLSRTVTAQLNSWPPLAMAVSHPPLPPVLAHTVAGRRVDVQWELPPYSPAALGYRLEVGSSPGGADVVTINAGASATLTVPDAPPGRYYVRVRAANAAAVGAASNEVVIDVP